MYCIQILPATKHLILVTACLSSGSCDNKKLRTTAYLIFCIKATLKTRFLSLPGVLRTLILSQNISNIMTDSIVQSICLHHPITGMKYFLPPGLQIVQCCVSSMYAILIYPNMVVYPCRYFVTPLARPTV